MNIIPLESLKPIASTDTVSHTTESSLDSFANYLTEAVNKVQDLESASSESAYQLATGQTDDLTGVMLDSVRAQTAVELATQVTTRAVNAYKEIMQMQI